MWIIASACHPPRACLSLRPTSSDGRSSSPETKFGHETRQLQWAVRRVSAARLLPLGCSLPPQARRERLARWWARRWRLLAAPPTLRLRPPPSHRRPASPWFLSPRPHPRHRMLQPRRRASALLATLGQMKPPGGLSSWRSKQRGLQRHPECVQCFCRPARPPNGPPTVSPPPVHSR